MHSSSTFRSYIKPATSHKVPRMYNEVQNLGLFSIDLDVTQLIFYCMPRKKSRINIYFLKFSIIKIDKQSLNHKFWGFILIPKVPWGWQRTKCPYHTTFFHQSGTIPTCFGGNTDIALDGHCGSDNYILITWTRSSCEIVKLKLMKYIPEYLYIRILKFLVFVFHQSELSSLTSILISRPETRQI